MCKHSLNSCEMAPTLKTFFRDKDIYFYSNFHTYSKVDKTLNLEIKTFFLLNFLILFINSLETYSKLNLEYSFIWNICSDSQSKFDELTIICSFILIVFIDSHWIQIHQCMNCVSSFNNYSTFETFVQMFQMYSWTYF